MAMNQRVRTASESLGFLAILGGILVALNVLGFFVSGRADLTEKRLYSLSEGSRDVAKRLSDTLTITAYFTEDLPPPFNATERQVLDLLEEYRAASGGKIVVNVVHPDEEDERQAAERDGVQKVTHQVYEDDAVSAMEGYRGLVLEYLGDEKVLAAIADTDGLEYTLTTKIKELIGDKHEIGILSGHDGPTLTKGLSRLRGCLPTYEITEVSATSEIDRDLRALLVIEPATALSEDELRRIDQFVMRGGSLGVFGGSMKISLEGYDPAATPIDTGINTLLRRWGVKVDDGVVADANCGRAPLQTRMGIPIGVPHPVVPIVSFDEAAREHPALFRLDGAPLPFISPLALTEAPRGVTVRTLARSTDNSWNIESSSVSLRPRMPQEWQQEGREGPFPVIVAMYSLMSS